ncbi:MAG: hypothetical protein QNJ54_34890 [Prochloraceae cyanobacterium]|nr:hypothetical protein [Prochloraceae cyanobacterium]
MRENSSALDRPTGPIRNLVVLHFDVRKGKFIEIRMLANTMKQFID